MQAIQLEIPDEFTKYPINQPIIHDLIAEKQNQIFVESGGRGERKPKIFGSQVAGLDCYNIVHTLGASLACMLHRNERVLSALRTCMK